MNIFRSLSLWQFGQRIQQFRSCENPTEQHVRIHSQCDCTSLASLQKKGSNPVSALQNDCWLHYKSLHAVNRQLGTLWLNGCPINPANSCDITEVIYTLIQFTFAAALPNLSFKDYMKYGSKTANCWIICKHTLHTLLCNDPQLFHSRKRARLSVTQPTET